MSFQYIAPPAQLNGSVEQQVSDIYTYLFRLSQTINLNSENTTPTAIFRAVDKALTNADSGAEKDSGLLSNYQQLKALVIKTADYAVSQGDSWKTRLTGSYITTGEFGKYKEETAAEIEANSQGITQMYTYMSELDVVNDTTEARIGVWEQAYVKTGLLYYDNATPVYGVGVGIVELDEETSDGTTINTSQRIATFSADEIAFWDGGNKTASLKSGAVYFPNAHITGGSIAIGDPDDPPFHVTNTGVLTCTGATVNGTLIAASGSKIGEWDVNTAIYNGKSSLSSTADGIYIGKDGIYVGKTASGVEKYIKLTSDGKLTANDADLTNATVSGTLTAGSGSKIADFTVNKTTGSPSISRIYSGSRSSLDSTDAGVYIGSDGISMGTPLAASGSGFKVTSSGALTCRGATITGAITATSLTISNGASVTGLSASSITTGTLDASKVSVTNINASNITTGSISADRISGGTIDASRISVTNLNASNITSGSLSAARITSGTMSADRISGGSIDASNVTITNLNASNITSGTLLSYYIKLYGDMAVYQSSTGSIGGHIGYNSGAYGSGGIGMSSTDGASYIAAINAGSGITVGGAKLHGGNSGYSNYTELIVNRDCFYVDLHYSTQNDHMITLAIHPTSGLCSLYPTNKQINLGDANALWNQIYAYNSTISTSDRTIKKDIDYDIDDYEALFDALKPVKYKFVDGTSNRYHTGFISQDVEEAIEETGFTSLDFAGFIKSEKEGAPGEYSYALRYEEFIALLALKIKKLETRIHALEVA